MDAAVWGVVGVVATAVLGYLGVRYTARAGKRASEYSALLQAPEAIAAGYDRLNEDLWSTVKDLRERVLHLEQENGKTYRKYRAAIGYIRRLLSLLSLHAPQVRIPTPPPELREDVHTGRDNPERKDPT